VNIKNEHKYIKKRLAEAVSLLASTINVQKFTLKYLEKDNIIKNTTCVDENANKYKRFRRTLSTN
jgi:hypothetical protein